MTCRDRANDLALYIGSDLPDESLEELERHLRECAACRVFLAELEASQAAVKDLAAEPVPEDARAAVRARLARARSQGPGRRAQWAVAAGLATAAVALFWLAAPGVRLPDSATTTTIPPDHSSVGGSGTKAASIAVGPSAAARPQPQNPTVKPASQTPPPRSSIPAPLTTADADQLARAVVAVSHIDHVSEPPPEGLPETTPAPFVRFATDDPDVVIYWRLDSDGGD